jgi:hypothetical protein
VGVGSGAGKVVDLLAVSFLGVRGINDLNSG